MDSGKYNFLVTFCSKCFHFTQHFFDFSAADTSSRKRNDTVSTELITAILYFQIGSGVFHRFFQRQFLILFCVIDIDQRFLHGTAFIISYMPTAPYELPYEGAKEMLLVDAVDNKEFLTGLFHAMYDELPALKPKKKK